MNVTAAYTVRIAAPLEAVFDFTQDWSRRAQWDATVTAAEAIPGEERAYRVRGPMGFRFVARYKLFRRPERTSLALTDFSWPGLRGGGGSWEYRVEEGLTVWTQTNTLVLRDGLLGRVLAPIVGISLASEARKAMEKAKALLESNGADFSG
jgi:uncharacterized protein YndB with AHSA1/START domain